MKSHIRALIIGAHPDDCEYHAGGLAAKYRRLGHVVKFVSLTNGDAGHHRMGGPELAARRLEEASGISREFGIEYEIFDIPDGRLEADLSTRERVIRLIREFRPDLVFAHRPNDYHPDHRAAGTLVMDASYLVRVPNICPETPHLSYSPAILSMKDPFTKPVPFTPDVAVAIDDVLHEKARMLHYHASQFYEWLPYAGGYEAEVPPSAVDRLGWTESRVRIRDADTADRYRSLLMARYGDTAGADIGCAEAFEVSEYGRPLSPKEIDACFPK